MIFFLRRSSLWLLLCLPFFSLGARQSSYSANVDEMRLELSDVKHELHSARIEISLLEERIAKQEQQRISTQGDEKLGPAEGLSKKVAECEKLLNKVLADVRTLSQQTSKALSRVQELEAALATQDKKFEEISKLKGMLTSLSQGVEAENKTPCPLKYSVKPGDSLEKIARHHHTSVAAIKQLNNLTQDKIVVGQELKLP